MSRLTVVETVYFQQRNGNPVSAQSKYAVELESDNEEPYQRRATATINWSKADFGWLKDRTGEIVLECLEGAPLKVGFGACVEHIMVQPGRSIRICTKLDLCVHSDPECRYRISVFPR